jgi:CRP/FNR family transcriptional regulator, anaerobic regulatory protein
MDGLIQLFSENQDLSLDEINFIRNNSEIKKFPKNYTLLSEGQNADAFYFVITGCLRLYYLAETEEKNAYFYTENMFVSSFLSFSKQTPAKHNIATIEESTLIKFDLNTVEKFINYSPKFAVLAKIMMEKELATYQQIISSFVTQDAEGRYLDFRKNHADLMKRIPQHHIATYLGVSPETLSRIRKRIVGK